MEFWCFKVDEPWLLTGLLLAAALDLLFRWLAFGRLESVAIDIALFSWLYGLIRSFESADEGFEWNQRLGIGLMILLVLLVIHLWLHRERLRRKLEEVFDDIHQNVSGDNLAEAANRFKRVATFAIDVAFIEMKMGKRERRDDFADALKAVGLDTNPEISGSSFLLPAKLRWAMIAVFFVLGLVSVMVPVTTIIP
jgi:hypothetical protein